MQQRYYDPVAGRFLSIDPVTTDMNTGGSFNRYIYANNSPYKYVDPDGRAARGIDINTDGYSWGSGGVRSGEEGGGGGSSKAAAAIPLNDKNGNAVIGGNNKPVRLPEGIDMALFAVRGRIAYSQLGEEGGIGIMLYDLSRFNRGYSWDLQRLNKGQFDPRFIDGATIAIGVYAASANIDIKTILNVQNMVAISATYPPGTVFDSTYTHLPVRNVRNTEIGYGLVKSGQFEEE